MVQTQGRADVSSSTLPPLQISVQEAGLFSACHDRDSGLPGTADQPTGRSPVAVLIYVGGVKASGAA